jgi:two-component system chemotaxis sensor kinase CheA
MRHLTQTSNKLVERLILGEATDAQATLREVAQAIEELRRLLPRLKGEAPDLEGGPAAQSWQQQTSTAAAAAPVVTAAACESDEEAPLKADDLPLVHDFVSESRGHIETAESSVLKLEESPQDPDAVNAIFRAFHTIKGVAGFLNLRQIGALAHSAENLLDLARQGAIALGGATVDVVLGAIDMMKTLVANVARAAAGDGVIGRTAELPALLERLAACAAGQGQVAETLPRSQVSNPVAGSAMPLVAPGAGAGASIAADATVRITTDRLDALINMVGELVIAQSMVAQDSKGLFAANQRLARNMSHLGKITRELQELSMSMRMVPINGVFQKMSRLVRDLAKKTGKEIDLVLVGGETELDRNLVEAITDPLVHMVRNAADHGLETPQERQLAGKSDPARIELKAYHQSGNVVIEITDNGRGLNKSRLVKKAVAAGIVSDGAQLSDQEIFKLVFHAGLSTAEKVTDVSGRGVGMDVVKRNVESLRGRIDIASDDGQGATFAIRLPLTLAVIDALVVKIGGDRLILPILSVEQSLRPKSDQLSTVQGRGEMCMVRHELLPLYRLDRLFRLKPGTQDPTQALIVIIRDDQRRCGLLVDELLGQQQVVIKALGETLGTIRGISGGAILGDGNVSLILDVPDLLDLASNH